MMILDSAPENWRKDFAERVNDNRIFLLYANAVSCAIRFRSFFCEYPQKVEEKRWKCLKFLSIHLNANEREDTSEFVWNKNLFLTYAVIEYYRERTVEWKHN